MTAAAAGIVAAPVLTAPAAHADSTATIQVIADHLKNPRGIAALPDGSVVVAEAGEGLPSCPDGQSCVAGTGAVFKVKGSFQGRVVTGLASTGTGSANGQLDVTGPTDVLPDPDGGYDIVSGLGGTTATRSAMGPQANTLGTVFRTRDGKVLGDLTDLETRLNPDGGEVHANPWSFVRSGSGFLVTDAGGNTLVRTTADGTASVDFLVPKNPTPVYTAEAVPTGMVRAKDGTVYFGDMSGTVSGSARIWRIPPGGTPEVFVTGLSNLVDLAVDCHGNLLALSYSKAFSQSGPPAPGTLSKIDTRTKAITEIPTGDQLNQPTGLAIGPWGQIYVTNNTVGNDGQLLRIRY